MTAAPVFDDLVGQERVVDQLSQAASAAAGLLRGETALGMTHAWLFTGPPGSGRSVAARAFAAALLCPDQGCGHCPSCHQVQAGTHPDLMLVRPDGLSYGVKQTRDLVLRAAGAPSGGRWQVVLFEDADRATEQAANALLKAIEEPVTAHRVAALRPVRGRTRHHDPVPVPAGHPAHPAGRGRRRGADPPGRRGPCSCARRRPGGAGPHRPGQAAGHRPRRGAAPGRGAARADPGGQPRHRADRRGRRWSRRPSRKPPRSPRS